MGGSPHITSRICKVELGPKSNFKLIERLVSFLESCAFLLRRFMREEIRVKGIKPPELVRE